MFSFFKKQVLRIAALTLMFVMFFISEAAIAGDDIEGYWITAQSLS